MKIYERQLYCGPSHLDSTFIFPDLPATVPIYSVTPSEKVRICGSLDMRWFTKGSGRSYDSLSGTATLMGGLSKKVLSTVT